MELKAGWRAIIVGMMTHSSERRFDNLSRFHLEGIDLVIDAVAAIPLRESVGFDCMAFSGLEGVLG